jgi:hypothetical protein
MKRILIAILLAVVVPACHRGPASEVIVVDPEPPQPAPTPPGWAQVVFESTNYDYYDYVLWIEWTNPDGSRSLVDLLLAGAATSDGPTVNWGVVAMNPAVTYSILLADPWGNVYDWYELTLPGPTAVDVFFDIYDGYLYRTP